MQSKKALLWAILISTAAFCLFLAFSMFRHIKRVERDFTDKKAKLVKENMELEDQYVAIQSEIRKKAEELTVLAEENEKLKKEFEEKIKTLEDENISLGRRVTELEEMSLIDRLRESLNREENEKVRKFLEKVLYNIVLIQSGKNIELEPIVVAKEGEGASRQRDEGGKPAGKEKSTEKAVEIEKSDLLKGKKGNIISVDRKYSLIVINLGQKDGITEEDTCVVLKNAEAIAEAKIISVRYKIAAAFIGETKHKYSIRNIKEGDEVLVVGND